MQPTGRQFAGATSTLIELQTAPEDEGPTYTAITLDTTYARVPAVRSAMTLGESFLAHPGVFGVVPLHASSDVSGRFVYHTGAAWSLAEVLQDISRRGKVLGARAAAEFAFVGTSMLIEAAENGSFAGVFCHGDVSPMRWMLRPNGEVMLIGYGLPELEAARMRHTQSDRPQAPTFRYAPPERAAGRPEDIWSDLYSLALIVVELAWGRPVYDGSSEAIMQAVRRGEAARVVSGLSVKRVPKAMRDVLLSMLQASPSARPEPSAWSLAWARLLEDGLKGATLAAFAKDLSKQQDRPSRWQAATPLDATSTRSFQMADLQRLAQEISAFDPSPSPRDTTAGRSAADRRAAQLRLRREKSRTSTTEPVNPSAPARRPEAPDEPSTLEIPQRSREPKATKPTTTEPATPQPDELEREDTEETPIPTSLPTSPDVPPETSTAAPTRKRGSKPKSPTKPTEPDGGDDTTTAAPKRASSSSKPTEPAAPETEELPKRSTRTKPARPTSRRAKKPKTS